MVDDLLQHKMSTKCRVWWPKYVTISSSNSKTKSLLLFGWFVSCSPSCLDVVVAFAYDEHFLSHQSSQSAIQVAIHHVNDEMPITLQDKSRFSILGRCMVTLESTDHMCKSNMVDSDHTHPFSCAEALSQNNQHGSSKNCGNWTSFLHSSTWIYLVTDSHSYSLNEIGWVPTLHHLHWNGKILSQAELHVMVYETPRFGSHHFSVNVCGPKYTKCLPKRPNWVDKLYQKPQHIDLDTVVVAINSSAAAKMHFDRGFGLQESSCRLSAMFLNFIWRLWAAVVASFSTVLYITLQLLRQLAVCGSKFWMCSTLGDIFSSTRRNIQVRCYQILYWPIFLNESGLRSRACVEYAEKAALRRHSLWSSVAVDIMLGNLVGFALLIHEEAVCKWISTLANHFTDDVLRTGCVWLMGVPAGFKLNTELAGVLGMMSLNAIQIWSTLWFSVSHILYFVIKLVALSGILLGMTVPAALFVDMIAVAAFHVSTLHCLTSLLYSLQIQALTALWRLFRGRKWNPLRQRLDSYEYSVQQHIVGSLLFTPLLLLLPTISVFYIFFTITNLTIVFFRTLIEVIVSVIHATPYTKIVLWLVRSRRFPSGIWFDFVHCQNASDESSVDRLLNGNSLPSKNVLQEQNLNAGNSGIMLSSLCINTLTLGQVISPHYLNFSSGIHGQTISSAISAVLTGKSISRVDELPKKMPWMFIAYKDYWRICYDAVLACLQS